MNKTILILSKYDSFARVAKCVADGFAAQGFIVDYRLISAGREALSHRVYHEIGLSEKTPVTTMDMLFQSGELAGFTAVYLGATGGFIRNFLMNMKIHFPCGTPRPLTIAGYPGVILREKLSGFSNRCGCDFVLLNSASDMEDYCIFCKDYGLDASGAYLLGYVFPEIYKLHNYNDNHILFIEQAAIPRSFKERFYVVQRLAAYASAHPEKKIVIKPRLIPGEKSIFTTQYHFEYILKLLPLLPHNLYIDYSDIQDLLNRAESCLTISSTVALQAMHYGLPVGIIRDFGIRDEYGTNFFQQSGCLTTFNDLETNEIPRCNREWFSKHFCYYKNMLPTLCEIIFQEYNRRKIEDNWKYNGNIDIIYCTQYQNFKNIHEKYRYAIIQVFLKNWFSLISNYLKILLRMVCNLWR